MDKRFFEATATLIGMVIGAGILGIPFVVARAGFITGAAVIIVIGFIVMMLNLYFGEIVLRTKEDHQLSGYAEKYLGKYGKKIMLFGMIFGLYGALIAYILQGGEFLYVLVKPIFGGNPLIYSFAFFIILSFLVYRGIKTVGKSEFLMVGLVLLIAIVIFLSAFSKIQAINLSEFNITKLFIPYGIVLFAYLGIAAVPEMRQELKKNEKWFKKAIIIGSLIPIIVYLLFGLVVVGVSGIENVTDDAIIGLGNVLGYKMLLFGTLFGILTLSTSFIAVGLALKEMYFFDFKLKETSSTALSCFIPMIAVALIIMAGIKNPFYKVLDFTGAISGGIIGILIVMMIWRAKTLGNRKPEYSIKESKLLNIIIIVMFLAGILYELIKLKGFLGI